MPRLMMSFCPCLGARLTSELHFFYVVVKMELIETIPVTSFNGWGLTAFDSLDTMLIMGLEEEYQKGLGVVRQANFSVSQAGVLPLVFAHSADRIFSTDRVWLRPFF